MYTTVHVVAHWTGRLSDNNEHPSNLPVRRFYHRSLLCLHKKRGTDYTIGGDSDGPTGFIFILNLTQMTQQEAAARLHEFNQTHADLNVYEDWSIIALFGAILIYVIVMAIVDNRKATRS